MNSLYNFPSIGTSIGHVLMTFAKPEVTLEIFKTPFFQNWPKRDLLMTLRKNDCSIIIDMFKNLGRSSSWWKGHFSRNLDENFNFDTWYEVKNFFDGDILKERPKIRKENVFLIRENSNKKLKILYMSIPTYNISM